MTTAHTIAITVPVTIADLTREEQRWMNQVVARRVKRCERDILAKREREAAQELPSVEERVHESRGAKPDQLRD